MILSEEHKEKMRLGREKAKLIKLNNMADEITPEMETEMAVVPESGDNIEKEMMIDGQLYIKTFNSKGDFIKLELK